MARKGGFFAEMQRQAQAAQKRQLQAQQQAFREQQAAQREHEKRLREYERTVAQMEKASAAEKKRLEAEAKQALIEARMAEVEEMNAALANTYSEIDSLLAATLAVDDFVDLENLRQTDPGHPPFPHPELEWPAPEIGSFVPPEAPHWVEPPPSGGLFGRMNHAKQIAQARQAFDVQYNQWKQSVTELERQHRVAQEAYADGERERVERLKHAREVYAAECAEREREATAANLRLDELISGLAYGVDSAVQEYVNVVLANSSYPDGFPVGYEHSFESGTGELTLTVEVPAPTEIPTVKAYKYTKSSDEITSTTLPVKEQKERYANAVLQVTLRTLHEVFEADRGGHIRTIAVTIGTTALNPATGRNEYVPLAMVAADRETFMNFELDKVVPAATLKHLGGVISKNPFELVPIDTGQGVRGRG